MAESAQPDWISFLASTAIFREVRPEALPDLVPELEMVDFPAGETLFEQGDPGDALYLLISGQLHVLAAGPEDQQRLLAVIGPGREVGELALWTGDRRSATVRTAVRSRAARLTRAAFDRFIARHPDALAPIDRHIAGRLRHAQLASALRLSGLFQELEESALRDFEASLETVWVHGGDTIFHQGEAGDALYIVVSGLVQVVVERPGEEPQVVAELGRGETFGEMALVENEPRSATVEAIRDSQLARLSRSDFERLLDAHPRAMLPVVTRKLVAMLREQRTGRSHAARALSTIAVVPAAPELPLVDFCTRLAASLRTDAATLVLSAARVDEYFGRPGAAQVTASQAGHGRILELLGKLEAEHRYVIYQADAPLAESITPWTARCLRQSDRVVIAADARGDPRRGAGEIAIASALNRRGARRASLALLHPDGSRRPSGTSRWLAARDVDRHYHVRMDSAADFARLARSLTGRAYGLVLGGGAARGFAHAGVIRALREAGIPIDLVGGTSAGAIFAATCGLEFDYHQSIEIVATGIAAMLANLTIPVVSLITGRDAALYLHKTIGDMHLEDLWLPCFSVSANLTRASVHVHKRGNLARSLLASSRLPAILPPILWDGDLLVDGGIIDNVPVDVMRGYPECGVVIAVDVSPAYDPPEITPFGDSISGWHALRQLMKRRSKRLRYPGIFSVLLRTMEFGGAAHKSQTVGAADLYLAPPVAQFKMNDFKRARQIADAGYEYAVPKIAEWMKSPAAAG
jgi:NTE family protein